MMALVGDEMSGWSGRWVAERLGVHLTTAEASAGLSLTDLVGLAVRRNPRRVQLLASTVLGKHVPTDPRLVREVGLRLGARVRGVVSGDVVVLGYAETATALGHLVSDALGAPYLHTTRRRVESIEAVGGFEEEHSHATSHVLLPADPGFLARGETLVLVDDELSTGKTVLNTIKSLHKQHPHAHYVVAALVDLRSDEDRHRMERTVKRLKADLSVVSLASGSADLPDDLVEKGNKLIETVEGLRSVAGVDAVPRPKGEVVRVVATWPRSVPEGGRHGFVPKEAGSFESAVTLTSAAIAGRISEGPVHVLGSEELMYAPLRIAAALADRRAAEGRRHEVTFSTTTRSPVLAVDDPGYAIRTSLTFPAHDDPADGDGPRYVYNLREDNYAAIVLVVDEPADTDALMAEGGLVDQLARLTPRVVVVTIPAHVPEPRQEQPLPPLPSPLRGPSFGSYAAEDVAWLLTDLSDVELEAPTEEREEAIQSGRAHYAESLPVEFQPDEAYQELFTKALSTSAERIAYAVGLVTEQVLALRGPDAVLVSLARSGTPIGVLMRRWAQRVHGLDLPHYAISIVRGRGIDEVALAYLASHHDPANVMFVDGWTGKGAITRELKASIEKANATLHAHLSSPFSPELAVLADPGACVSIYGTRDDYLVPSACLNSTVSGLVSRTVLNDELIGPGDFHGAKFYADLAGSDVSQRFVDAIAARFPVVRTRVMIDTAAHLGADHTPTWAGWDAVEEVADSYDIDQVNLVKPGVGETTRVLLRRVPWKILVNPARDADLEHVKMLAAARGVPLERVPGLPYSCIGLIHPRYTKGAVAADGRGAGR